MKITEDMSEENLKKAMLHLHKTIFNTLSAIHIVHGEDPFLYDLLVRSLGEFMISKALKGEWDAEEFREHLKHLYDTFLIRHQIKSKKENNNDSEERMD